MVMTRRKPQGSVQTESQPGQPGDVLANWDAALDETEWVTLPEAAAAAGVSVSALRTWYRRNDVTSQLAPGPHGQQRLVRLEDVLERAARSPVVQRGQAGGRAVDDDDGGGAAGAMTLLARQLERTEQRAERAEAALREMIARAAAAEAERDVLRRLLDQQG
jgi:hypothetical protein